MRSSGDGTIPTRGAAAITVPGAVRSWADAHERFGRLAPDVLLAPAIELARDGVPVSARFARVVEVAAPVIASALGPDAAVLKVMRPEGRPWRPGERLRQPALAATLERLATDGFAALYEGDLGDRQADGLARAGCLVRADDLAAHESTWADPIGIDYRRVRVTTHPPTAPGSSPSRSCRSWAGSIRPGAPPSGPRA
jgi:gamma-glutamyltranspeptidase/glutathione hydrolase